MTSDKVGKTFSIIPDPVFKTAKKSLNAKLKKIKESGTSKVKRHCSIQLEDIQKCYDSGVCGDDSPLALLRVNWFNVNLYFCRRGRENQRKLTRNSFVFKKDASGVEFIEMAEDEKTKTILGGLATKLMKRIQRFKIQDYVFFFALFVSLTAINIEIKGEN